MSATLPQRAEADRATFARLFPVLVRYGLRVERSGTTEHRRLLRVVNPDGPSTSIYVIRRTGGEPAVYGFTDLYVGVAAEPERVAARLAWLLGMAGDPPHEPGKVRRADATPRLLTPAEVARVFRVDPKTVGRWAETGRLPSIRTLGGHRRYRLTDLLPYLRPITTSPDGTTNQPEKGAPCPPSATTGPTRGGRT